VARSRLVVPLALSGVAGLFLLTNLATSFYIQQIILRPRRKKNKTEVLDDFQPEVRYESATVQFPSSDGIRLCALVLTPENPNGHGIVVCHGLAHSKNSGVRFVQYLLGAGYTLLLIDFRNHGDSEGNYTTYGYLEKQDLLAAIRYLRDSVRIAGRIGIIGASMGASIAILAAAECPDVSALVLDSPFSSLRKITKEAICKMTGLPLFLLSLPIHLAFVTMRLFGRLDVPSVEPAAKIGKVSCPVFLIHGSKDKKIAVHHSREIFENANAPRELWIAQDADHLETYLQNPKSYQQRVLAFFETHLNNRKVAKISS